MRRLSWVWAAALVIVVGVGAGVGGYYYQKSQAETAKSALQKQLDGLKKVKVTVVTPKPAVEKVTFTETNFSFQAPAGWVKADPPQGGVGPVGSGTFFYTDSAGDFFQVDVDPAGFDFAANATWTLGLNVTKDGVVITQEGAVRSCQQGDLGCPEAGKLVISAAPTASDASAPAPTVKGHKYFFFFGNTKKETGVDLQVFRDIFTSFKAQ